MENNKYKLDTRRINDMAESLVLLLEYYEPKDIVNVYIYDLIAYLILNYSKSKVSNEQFDEFIIHLILNLQKEEFINMDYKSLENIINLIKKYSILDKNFEFLQEMYIKKEQNIENEYITNMDPRAFKIDDYTVDYNNSSLYKNVHEKINKDIVNEMLKSMDAVEEQNTTKDIIINYVIDQTLQENIQNGTEMEPIGKKKK